MAGEKDGERREGISTKKTSDPSVLDRYRPALAYAYARPGHSRLISRGIYTYRTGIHVSPDHDQCIWFVPQDFEQTRLNFLTYPIQFEDRQGQASLCFTVSTSLFMRGGIVDSRGHGPHKTNWNPAQFCALGAPANIYFILSHFLSALFLLSHSFFFIYHLRYIWKRSSLSWTTWWYMYAAAEERMKSTDCATNHSLFHGGADLLSLCCLLFFWLTLFLM